MRGRGRLGRDEGEARRAYRSVGMKVQEVEEEERM